MMPRGYKPRSIDELAAEALKVILKTPGVRCGYIGDELFGDHGRLSGSAPYARIAGKVMKKLESEGLAYYNGGSVRV